MFYKIFLNLRDWNSWIKFFKSVYVLMLFFLIYFPWFFIVFLSFLEPSKKGTVITTFGSSFDYGQNYINFFTDPSYSNNFWNGFINSLIIAIFTIPISLFIGLLSSISIWKSYGKHKNAMFSLSNLSIGTPDIIQGISFFALFLTCFLPLGINFGFFTVIISHIAISIPYVIIFLYPRISKINQKILLASHDLKYGMYETIFKILIPMIMPNIIYASLLVFTLSFDDFIITNLVRGNLTTITSELYTMRKGIKMWSVTFGALVFWFSIFISIIYSGFKIFSSKQEQKNYV